ncbi:GNAT family N-acetyltransferase [Oceanihabitans sp. IOP_32]|uniref:GNAT family N-acetyltransferase n=1 Tax=Oceanihabitans sp. IOP_32 TaxID=2529032 RepID=UPI001293854C|nr:GNAT family N-acetyltransferase [Oceanihabitans sp. IOP_32]QFZ53483.1 GNAT family N-acetyltransferase [Oceanihabitans sp. IOP_32]
MIAIVPANKTKDYKIIEHLAHTIWHEHYVPIIGKAQVEYMLDTFQSETAILKQIHDEGLEYFILTFNKIPAGYIAFKKEDKHLFLSKLYVLEAFRGQKIGKTAMNFVVEKAQTYSLQAIKLGVNVNNINAIKAYQKLGFKATGKQLTNIGKGFFMDDFIMEKPL